MSLLISLILSVTGCTDRGDIIPKEEALTADTRAEESAQADASISEIGEQDAAPQPPDVQPDPELASQWGRADPSCSPPDNPAVMPSTAREYAVLCAEHGLGIPPTVNCDDAVRVPTTVEGQEVFETPDVCDHTSMLKPSCTLGSKIGRVQGRDEGGVILPDVVWVYFCRAAANTSDSSVQMIGYHYTSGATCFFEANEGPQSYLREVLGRDEFNGLTGQMPAPDEPLFDRAFIPAPIQCVECHQNNPFIRNPWLDAARLPERPTEPVLPTLDARSPYYVVGGAAWDMRTIHIEGNACLSCHRIGMEIDQIFMDNGFNVNTYMPPSAPGSMMDDYQALLECWSQGPESTPGCEWVIPPAGDCEGGTVGVDYPYASTDFNQVGRDETSDDFEGDECPPSAVVGDPCEGDPLSTACTRGEEWLWCEGGRWRSK